MSSFVLPMWAGIALALLAVVGVIALLAQRNTLRSERDENRRLKDQVSAMLQPNGKWPGMRRMAMSNSTEPAPAVTWSKKLSNWFLVALVLLIVAYATALLLTLLLR